MWVNLVHDLASSYHQMANYKLRPELTFMHRFYRLVRKHDQPKDSTRNFQRDKKRETNVNTVRRT